MNTITSLELLRQLGKCNSTGSFDRFVQWYNKSFYCKYILFSQLVSVNFPIDLLIYFIEKFLDDDGDWRIVYDTQFYIVYYRRNDLTKYGKIRILEGEQYPYDKIASVIIKIFDSPSIIDVNEITPFD